MKENPKVESLSAIPVINQGSIFSPLKGPELKSELFFRSFLGFGIVPFLGFLELFDSLAKTSVIYTEIKAKLQKE